MLSSSNLQLSLFLMSTKSYLKFRTIRKKVGGFWKASIRDTPTKVGGFGKAPIRDTLPWVLESPYQRYPQKWVGFGKPLICITTTGPAHLVPYLLPQSDGLILDVPHASFLVGDVGVLAMLLHGVHQLLVHLGQVAVGKM